MLPIDDVELGPGILSLLLIQDIRRVVRSAAKIAKLVRGSRHDPAALKILHAVTEALPRRALIRDLECVAVVWPSYCIIAPWKRVIMADVLGVPAGNGERENALA